MLPEIWAEACSRAADVWAATVGKKMYIYNQSSQCIEVHYIQISQIRDIQKR
jgi:hypothetical protein